MNYLLYFVVFLVKVRKILANAVPCLHIPPSLTLRCFTEGQQCGEANGKHWSNKTPGTDQQCRKKVTHQEDHLLC